MNSKKILSLGALAIMLIVIALLVTPHKPTEAIIGVLLPLTGASASIGERVKAGIEAGEAELREKEGIDLNLVIEDDKGEAATAVSAAQKLMNVDHVRLIIGTVKSDAMLAVAPVTEGRSVILLSPTAGAAAISSAGDFVFRVIETPNVHGYAAAKKLAGNKVALFTANASNAQSYGAAFKQSFGQVAYETAYGPTETDFRSQIAQALSADATAFYLAVATAKDAGVLVKQIREAGFTGLVMASVAADAKEFFDAAGPYAEGTIITASFFDKSTPAGAAFNERYRAITGNDGDGFAANGYDAVMLLGKAVKKCGTEDTACVRDFLYATKDYAGAGGTLSFNPNGDVTKPVSYKTAKSGAFVLTD